MPDLETLLQGFEIFRKKFLYRSSPQKIDNLAKTQNPRTLIVSCSDSRVDPAILLHFQLGEVFSIRNIANIVPPFQLDHSTYHGTSSALEYAVKILNVETIVVLGHSGCGGIQALLEHKESEKNEFDFIIEWVFILNEAKQEVLQKNPKSPELAHLCEKKGIEVSLRNLETFPFIKRKIEEGKLKTLGLYFSMSDLHLEYYDSSLQTFKVY